MFSQQSYHQSSYGSSNHNDDILNAAIVSSNYSSLPNPTEQKDIHLTAKHQKAHGFLNAALCSLVIQCIQQNLIPTTQQIVDANPRIPPSQAMNISRKWTEKIRNKLDIVQDNDGRYYLISAGEKNRGRRFILEEELEDRFWEVHNGDGRHLTKSKFQKEFCERYALTAPFGVNIKKMMEDYWDLCAVCKGLREGDQQHQNGGDKALDKKDGGGGVGGGGAAGSGSKYNSWEMIYETPTDLFLQNPYTTVGLADMSPAPNVIQMTEQEKQINHLILSNNPSLLVDQLKDVLNKIDNLSASDVHVQEKAYQVIVDWMHTESRQQRFDAMAKKRKLDAQ